MSDGTILVIVVIIVIIISWKKLRGENSYLHGREVRECPVCNQKTAIIDTIRDENFETIEVIRCMRKDCNVRIKNFDGPDLEEEMQIKQEGRLIDQAEIRTKDMEALLKLKGRRLTKLKEETEEIDKKLETLDTSEAVPETVEETPEPSIPKTNRNKAYQNLELTILGIKATSAATEITKQEVINEPEPPEPPENYFSEKQYISEDDYSHEYESNYDTSESEFAAGMDTVIDVIRGKLG